MKELLIRLALAGLVGVAPLGAWAQYPTKPIRFITSSAPGGVVDIRARAYAQRLTESFGQPVMVENRPGASGTIAADSVIKATPDGYTMLFGSTQELIFPAILSTTIHYDPVRDLTPVVLTSTGYPLLAVHHSLDVRSVTELVTLARARTNPMTCATAGTASLQHFACAYFSKLAGVASLAVPYKGSAPAILEASVGRVEFVFGFPPELQQYVISGALIPLGVLGPRRLGQFPEVKTMAELGYPDLEIQGWTCLMAPKGTPRDIVGRLNSEVIKIATHTDLAEWLVKSGAVFIELTPEGSGEFVRSQLMKWRRISAETGIKPQ